MDLNVLVIIGICIVIGGAVAWDLRTGKIPNILNGLLVFCGILYSGIFGGLQGAMRSFVGVIIPVAVLMILFYFQIIGAGDIKLFSGIGAFVTTDVLWVIVYSFLACGIYGLIIMLVRLIRSVLSGDSKAILLAITGRKLKLTKVAFSVFIAIGFGWYLVGGL